MEWKDEKTKRKILLYILRFGIGWCDSETVDFSWRFRGWSFRCVDETKLATKNVLLPGKAFFVRLSFRNNGGRGGVVDRSVRFYGMGEPHITADD